MRLIENLKWRYATKRFDSSKKIPKKDIEKLKETIQLSASSYGLQPYKVLIIENNELRKKLKPFSWDQSQITDASHLFVFCNHKSVNEKDVAKYVQLKADCQGLNIQELDDYKNFIVGKLSEKPEDEQRNWTAKQAYIALGNLLTACSELRIDACPIEGFEPEKYDELLGLSKKGISVVV